MLSPTISFGPVTFYWYGLILGIALYLMYELGLRIWRREKGKVKDWEQAVLWTVVFGLIGARLYHVIDYYPEYIKQPGLIFQVWRGGLGIWGGIGGGVGGLWLKMGRGKRKQVFWKLIDTMALVLPLGQAVGRVGNWVNQELYGLPTTAWWGIPIDLEHRWPGYEQHPKFLPLFAFEGGLLLILAGVLAWLYWNKKVRFGQGGLAALYVLGYGGIRMGLEKLRIEPWLIFGVPAATWVAILGMVISLGYLIQRGRKIWTNG